MTILLIGALIFGANQFITLEKYKNEDTVPISDLIEVENQLAGATQLLEIDKDWIQNNDVKSALNKYSEFKSQNPDLFSDWVNSRIERLKDLQGSSKDDELTKLNLRTQLREAEEKISSLSIQSDSLQLLASRKNQQFKRKADSLSKIINQQDLQLKRKEDVKVISFRNDNGNLIHYIGETRDGLANGPGIGIWNTGSIYRGEWINNKRNGEGEFVWDDGAKYKGEFKMGERSGEGTFYYVSGEKYIGEFKKGLRDGYGVLYDRDGNVSYEGNWANDKPKQ